jgi:hypothetical protein
VKVAVMVSVVGFVIKDDLQTYCPYESAACGLCYFSKKTEAVLYPVLTSLIIRHLK